MITCSFLALIFLYSCIHPSTGFEETKAKKEYELIGDLFFDLTRPLPRFIPKDTTKEAMKEFHIKYENWISENTFELYIYDSLFVPDLDLYHLLDLDPSFDSIYTSLFHDDELKTKSLDLSLLPERSNFKLLLMNSDKYSDTLYDSISKNEAYQGFFEFSRIAFNKNYSKACFYFARHLGPKSGGGEIIFTEKKNGKWTIIERKMIWVS